MTCFECEKEVDHDNVSLCKKLYSRGIKIAFCYDCLAKRENTTVEKLHELVMHYRKMGCMMFTPLDE